MADDKTQAAQDAPTVPRAEYEELSSRYGELAAEHARAQEVIDKQRDAMEELAGLLRRGGSAASGEGRNGGNAHIDAVEKAIDKMVAAQNGRGVRGDGHHMVWWRSVMLDEFIQGDRQLRDLTLLKPEVFEYIVHKVEEYMETDGGKLYYDLKMRSSDPGNRSKLRMRYMVFMDFFVKRTNAMPAVVGALFGMHRTTVRSKRKGVMPEG